MMDFYDATLVPYPFDKYTMVEGSFGGGMEHQTCSLMGDILVTGGLSFEWITAHELAHQWFGDLVTLENWQHIWLNESFATFYDAAWHEDFYGTTRFQTRMASFENSVFNAEHHPTNPRLHTIVDPPANNLFSPLVYYKGAWVLRMLRDLIGKPAFDAAVTDYLTTHAYGNADTEDLKAAFENSSGQDLDWYFDQWVYTGIGHPHLEYYRVYYDAGDVWKLRVEVFQTQTTPTIYRLPLEIEVDLTGGGEMTFDVWLESADEVFWFDLPAEPSQVTLDPYNKLLGEPAQLTVPAGLFDETPGAARLAAWPNPFFRAVTFAFSPELGEVQSVEIFDVAGRRVRQIPVADPAGGARWDGTGESGQRLAPGVYYVRPTGTREAVRVLLLSRPR
jgi:aminopeptidase N